MMRRREAATQPLLPRWGTGAIAVPVEPIPGLDILYDLGVPIALMWYWFTFFRDVLRSSSGLHHTPAAIEPETYSSIGLAEIILSSALCKIGSRW